MKKYRVVSECNVPYSNDDMIHLLFESDDCEEAKKYFDSHKNGKKGGYYTHYLQERDYCYKTIEKDNK